MTDTPQVLLAHHLKTLKLPTFLREYDKLARQCATEGADHVRYLVRLTELELIDRERRMVERRIRQARFPAVIVGEARIVERAFDLGPCALTEAVALLQDRLANAET